MPLAPASRMKRLNRAAAALAACAVFVQVRTSIAQTRHRVRGSFVEVGGVRLHYLERGQGPTLVLLHGIGSMIDDFVLSGLVARAAEQYRVIAIDPTVRLDAPLLLPPAIPLTGDLMRYTVSPILGRVLWPAWLRLIFPK